jgi:DNA modification methylase
MRKEIQSDHDQMHLLSNTAKVAIRKPATRRISAERLPTNTTSANHPIHRWFNFIAGFSPEFVDNVCRDSLADRRPSLLLDPFAGCGTAPLEAVAQGIDAVGYEAHPFFERICRAKLSGPGDLQRIDEIERAIVVGLEKRASISLLGETQKIFLEKLFPESVLTQLLGARESLAAQSLTNDPLAFMVLSKTLDRSSHSATDGIYKAPTSKKRAHSPKEAVSIVCDMIRTDLMSLSDLHLAHRSQIFGKSSEAMTELEDGSVSIVVTSPPYLNNFDYAEMTRMQLYFWGMASSWGEITDKVRSRLIVNTTTALKGHKHLQQEYRSEIPSVVHDELDQIVRALGERRSEKAGKKEYDFLVYPYFAQMARVLRECFRVMRPGASIHIMVADSALYGIHIKAPQILSRILKSICFENVECALVRKRGHRWVLEKREGAHEGLGEYHIQANR